MDTLVPSQPMPVAKKVTKEQEEENSRNVQGAFAVNGPNRNPFIGQLGEQQQIDPEVTGEEEIPNNQALPQENMNDEVQDLKRKLDEQDRDLQEVKIRRDVNFEIRLNENEQRINEEMMRNKVLTFEEKAKESLRAEMKEMIRELQNYLPQDRVNQKGPDDDTISRLQNALALKDAELKTAEQQLMLSRSIADSQQVALEKANDENMEQIKKSAINTEQHSRAIEQKLAELNSENQLTQQENERIRNEMILLQESAKKVELANKSFEALKKEYETKLAQMETSTSETMEIDDRSQMEERIKQLQAEVKLAEARVKTASLDEKASQRVEIAELKEEIETLKGMTLDEQFTQTGKELEQNKRELSQLKSELETLEKFKKSAEKQREDEQMRQKINAEVERLDKANKTQIAQSFGSDNFQDLVDAKRLKQLKEFVAKDEEVISLREQLATMSQDNQRRVEMEQRINDIREGVQKDPEFMKMKAFFEQNGTMDIPGTMSDRAELTTQKVLKEAGISPFSDNRGARPFGSNPVEHRSDNSIPLPQAVKFFQVIHEMMMEDFKAARDMTDHAIKTTSK